MGTEADDLRVELVADQDGTGSAHLRIAGSWRLGRATPATDHVVRDAHGAQRLRIDGSALAGWDSSLIVWLLRLRAEAGAAGIALDGDGLPNGARRLLALADSAPAAHATESVQPLGWLDGLGWRVLALWGGLVVLCDFIGRVSLALVALARGRAHMRRRDLLVVIEDAGARALPIVSLISVLTGVILAFVGAIQLTRFGAEIFVANLVTIGMLREMGAMMPAIILAGRTGAAFAAELGTMQVNEEIDALATTGIEPVELLVLPRVLGLVLMMPLLAVYANLLGIAGGGLIAALLFGITPDQYAHQARQFVDFGDLGGGLFKALVFGVIIAVAGCLTGLRAGRSSAEVGRATTAAVVGAIVAIVVADSALTVVYHVLGI